MSMRTRSIRLCVTRSLHGGERVENAFDETKVFIEVQFVNKVISRTSSGLLFDKELVPGNVSSSPLIPKFFQISFADLFSSDIFRNCDLSPLLSLNILDDHHSKHKFWNMFKRYVSRRGNKAGKHWLNKKPKSMIIITAPVMLIQTHVNKEANEEAYLEKLGVLRNALSRDCIVDELAEKDDYRAILETTYLMKFNLDDDDSNCSSTCAICLRDFEKGTSILELDCQHIFHLGCVIHWMNTNPFIIISCPLCRDDTGNCCYC